MTTVIVITKQPETPKGRFTPYTPVSRQYQLEEFISLDDDIILGGAQQGGRDSNFRVSAFHKKCLREGKCVACYLPIQFAQFCRAEENALPHLYFFGMRDSKPVRFTKDHIVPASRGGADALTNIQIMCNDCNNYKADSLSNNPFHWTVRWLITYQHSLSTYNSSFNNGFIDEETFANRAQRILRVREAKMALAKKLYGIELNYEIQPNLPQQNADSAE